MPDTGSQVDDAFRPSDQRANSLHSRSRRTDSWTSSNDAFVLGDIGHLRDRQSQLPGETDQDLDFRISGDSGALEEDIEQSQARQSQSREEIEPRSDSYHPAHASGAYSSKNTDDSLPKDQSSYNRIGLGTILLLSFTTLLALAVIAFLGFLSYGNVHQQIWHAIMINGWATRSLTVSALVLRICTDMQAGIVVCMLASTALELNAVSLLDVPAVAFARASSIPPYMLLLRPSFCKMPFRRQVPWSGPVILAPLLCLTTILLQFSSTILVSDLQLGTLPGQPYEEDVFYDFLYNETPIPGMLMMTEYPMQPRQSTWLQSPPTFPSFAEYREKGPATEGVDDTGILLRAFVPFPQTAKRESLRDYAGKASVLDSRVSCQAPVLDNLNLSLVEGHTILEASRYYEISGTYRPSEAADRSLPTSDDVPNDVPFTCALSTELVPQSSLCSLSCPFYNNGETTCIGGLLSQFANSSKRTITPDYHSYGLGNLTVNWGHPYLFWDAPPEPRERSNATNVNLTQPQQHGVWTEVRTNGGASWVNVTLCYTSWDTARLQVEMYSDSNRTEPVGSWDPQSGLQTAPDILQQIGNGLDVEKPLGALHLKSQKSWTRHNDDEIPLNVPPLGLHIANSLDGEGAGRESEVMSPVHAGLTVYLEGSDSGRAGITHCTTPITANEDLATLFRRFRTSSGSIAWALASMITVLSGMAYYDQMARFQTSTKATQVHFTTVLQPQSHLGFLGVVILVCVHLVIVAAATVLFLRITNYTLLSNYWQSLAHIQTSEVLDVSSGCANASDKEIRAKARREGWQNVTFRFPVSSVGEPETDRLVEA